MFTNPENTNLLSDYIPEKNCKLLTDLFEWDKEHDFQEFKLSLTE